MVLLFAPDFRPAQHGSVGFIDRVKWPHLTEERGPLGGAEVEGGLNQRGMQLSLIFLGVVTFQPITAVSGSFGCFLVTNLEETPR